MGDQLKRAKVGPPLKDSESMIVTEPFSVLVDGVHVGFSPEDRVHKNDPLVEEHPQFFATAKQYERLQREATETATQAEATPAEEPIPDEPTSSEEPVPGEELDEDGDQVAGEFLEEAPAEEQAADQG